MKQIVRDKIKWIGLAVFFLATLSLHAQMSAKDLYKAIRKGDTVLMDKYFSAGFDINGFYGPKENKTPLHTAVVADEAAAVKYLIRQGADLNKFSKDRTPLMWAATFDKLNIARMLLDNGADINLEDNKQNTALFYSAINSSLRLNKLLVQRGADVDHENYKGWRAVENSVSSNKDTVSNYLKTMVVRKEKYDTVPDYFDGPHMIWENHKEVMMVYLDRDKEKNLTRLIDHTYSFEGRIKTFNGFLSDTNTYTIYRDLIPKKSIYKDVEKMFVVGDMHGQYDTLVYLLQNSEIIDEQLNWKWGRGHLVFTGDLLDRGSHVTETLWFIYKLERQAMEEGGYVHVLLGNHEIMNILDDLRYLNKKYLFFSDYFDLNYSQFLTTRTVLGEWLRSKQVAITINDFLFVHGGISPQLLKQHITLDSMNQCVYKYLNGGYDEKNAPVLNLLLFTFGPFWYRGYFSDGNNAAEASQELIDETLAFYNVDHIVIGHTDVKKIVPMYNGKVFPIDIPFDHQGFMQQSLLIIDEDKYRVYSSGDKIKL